MPVGRAILLGALVCACGEAAGPPGSLSVFVVGRLERGSVVVVQARSGTDLVPDTSVTWSAQPSDAVQFPAPGRALLARATPVVLTAAKAGATGSLGFEVAVPPTIVFDLLRDGNRDIYKAALDGGDLARLTTDPADDVRPTAAGATVVFVSYRDGRGALYAVPLAGGPDHRLAVATGEESDPALSPDGRRLAYVESDGGAPKLWLADADGGNAARATTGFGFPGSVEVSPTWAPAGDRVAFVATAYGNAGLFQLLTGAGAISPLTNDATPDVEPAWSADGGRIAFASERNGATNVYVLEVANGSVSRLSTGPGTDGEPAWLGDGRLVYVNWTDGVPRLCWLDPAAPDSVHAIDLGPGAPAHPKGVP